MEADEVKLLTDLGHQVFSLGAYQNPLQPQDMKRPPIENGFYNDHLQSVALQCSKENLHQELIDWADVIIVMHRPDWILNNWDKMKKKRVVWRTIGQSTPDIEGSMALLKNEGLKIVRMSPVESEFPNFAGQDALIRFYKDENEFKGYTGALPSVITVAQSMKKRGVFCGFEHFEEVTRDFARTIYGPDNEDSGLSGGLLTYEELKEAYRVNRVFFYTGTYPSSYTLGLIEAMMTGQPVVALGEALWDIHLWNFKPYEVNRILNGKNGFCSDNKNELKDYVSSLLNDLDLATKVGAEGRKTAIELFGKDTAKRNWMEFLYTC